MAINKLSNLFDEKLKKQNDLIASPPQSLETISEKTEEQEFVLQRLQQFDRSEPKVDYSDFSNFVFFNSALDYFNITGESILNEYPYDGALNVIEEHMNGLDGYQRYVVKEAWPRKGAHLRFSPSQGNAYVLVDDIGQSAGTARSALLSPGTGSLSIEFWCVPPPALTGSNDVMYVLQKASGSSDYTVYFSGSSVRFRMSSGSTSGEVSAPAVPGQISYFACVFDKSSTTPVISIMSGNQSEFPVMVSSSSLSITGPMYLGGSRLSIASGTLSSKTMRPLTGSLDNIRIWSIPLSLIDVTSSFNTKVYAQNGLTALWRFNETWQTSSLYPLGADSAIVRDYSGHRLDGRIQNQYYSLRSSGSLVPYETPDLVLSFYAPEVQTYITEQQTSGTNYDNSNDNLITRMLPDQFFVLEDEKNTTVLRDFVYIIARQFDFVKIHIDQFLNVLRSNYTRFNQTPDALLSEVARFFGWDFVGNFLNADVIQYILGKGVLANVEANKELDIKLYEIKNRFWSRTLNNLIYLYKTKGTRESVESLLRIYGVNRNFVKLKEYGLKPAAGINTFRIASDKSVPALMFGSGTLTGTNYVTSKLFNSVAATVESRVRFPTSTSTNMQAALITGSIWTLNSTGSNNPIYRLYYTKDAVSSHTGSLILTSSNGQLILSGVEIFDNRWYNVAVVRDHRSSSFAIDVRSIDGTEVDKHYQVSGTSAAFDNGTKGFYLWLGSTGSIQSQMWNQEVRVWDEALGDIELEDHALNFQSYGTQDVLGNLSLSMHWRLRENEETDSNGRILNGIIDVSTNNVSGSAFGFAASTNPYVKFLNEYNFIAPPDYGWNEEKIRIIGSSQVKPYEAFSDVRTVALEFNMVDALNEDISQILATIDGFNNSIGLNVNRYRSSYHDLTVLRENYFKRLEGRLNFRKFADMIEFFDRSFLDMVRRLIPARAMFLGDEFVVESHMLERPKLQWNYRRAPAKFEPLGIIKVVIRI